MSIASDLIRGHTETIVLAQLSQRDSYGYEINKAIQTRTEGRYELKEATLYSAFRRLEQGQCVKSYWGGEETGARRRYYSITPVGRAVLEQNRNDWYESKELIEKLIIAEGMNE